MELIIHARERAKERQNLYIFFFQNNLPRIKVNDFERESILLFFWERWYELCIDSLPVPDFSI